MKKFLRNSAILTLVMIAGISSFSFAQNKQSVKAYLDKHTLYLGGKEIKPSGESTPLAYKGHIYVPLRFVSEKLNMDVSYDRSTRSVTIRPKEQASMAELMTLREENKKLKFAKSSLEEELARIKKDNNEKTLKIMKSENDQGLKYEKPPITYTDKDFEVKYTLFVREDQNKHSSFYFEIKNDNSYGINIDTDSAKFTYNEKLNGSNDVRTIEVGKDDLLADEISTKINSTLQEGFKDTGFFVFNRVPDEVHEGILSFYYYKYGDEKNKKEIKFAIKLD